MQTFVHITPALPPESNGLGDFCSLLMEKARHTSRYKHHLLVYRQKHTTIKHIPVTNFTPQSLKAELLRLQPDHILLHYVGYGYHRRGIPTYLPAALDTCLRHTKAKLSIYLHELYATSTNPFSSTFYLSNLQKRIVARLCSLAYRTFTSCEAYHLLLKNLDAESSLKNRITGLCTNVPEDLFCDGLTKKGTLVVFGSQERRSEVYQQLHFPGILHRLKIHTIEDIGPGHAPFQYSGIQRHIYGKLPLPEVAAHLNTAQYGALHYPYPLLEKSSIFAAYAAFGVIPVNTFQQAGPSCNPLYPGMYYAGHALLHSFQSDSWELQRKSMRQWYAQRNAATVSRLIFPTDQSMICSHC